MTHVRKRLRDDVKAALALGVPAVEGRVGGWRGYARNAPILPALEVSTPVSSQTVMSDDGDLDRRFNLSVRILAQTARGGDVEDDLDALAEAVEAVVWTLPEPWAGAVLEASSEFEGREGGGERPAGELVLVFAVRVYTDADAPQG